MVISVISSTLYQRQVVRTPATHALCQAVYMGVASGLELLGKGAGMLAVGACQDDRFVLVLLQFDHAFGEAILWNVDGIDDMTGSEVFLRPHIDDQCILPVDQRRGLLGGNGFARLAAFGDDQQRKYNQKGASQPIMVAYEFDKVL